MYCTKCGAQLPDGAGFCQKCGAKLDTEGNEQKQAFTRMNAGQMQSEANVADTPKKKNPKKLFINSVGMVKTLIIIMMDWLNLWSGTRFRGNA